MGRIFLPTLSLRAANVKGVGAAAIYRHLERRQETPISWRGMNAARDWFNDLLMLENRNWELPPIEKTTFSTENLAAMAMPDGGKDDAPAAPIVPTPDQPSPVAMIVASTHHTLEQASMLRHVENLEPLAQRESVENAQRILQWLKSLKFQDVDMQEMAGARAP